MTPAEMDSSKAFDFGYDTDRLRIGSMVVINQRRNVMRKTGFFALPLICLLVSSCGHITGGVAPSTEPLAPGSYRELGQVKGQDCVYYLLGFIPLSDGNETKDAVADALLKAPGASALVKVSSDTYTQNYILIARACTQVQNLSESSTGVTMRTDPQGDLHPAAVPSGYEFSDYVLIVFVVEF